MTKVCKFVDNMNVHLSGGVEEFKQDPLPVNQFRTTVNFLYKQQRINGLCQGSSHTVLNMT